MKTNKLPFARKHIRHFKQVMAVTIIFFISSYSLNAQLSQKYKGYEEHYYKGIRYGLFKPADYDAKKKYPLIVYLHGSTDTVSRDLNWYQSSIQREHPCFVLTPKCEESNQGWGNTWREGHTAATAKTISLADSLIKSYSIDTNRLYLYGISMGGFGVFSILQKESGKFAAAYAVCGGSSPKAAAKIKGTPLWIFHGEIDDVVPVYLSRDIYKEILKLGGKLVRYTEYPSVKHNSWENVSRENTLNKWLFLQEKGKADGSIDQVLNFSGQLQNNSVALKWSKPDQQVWYYKLFRDNTVLAEIDGESTTYTDPGFEKGIKHSYYVVAVNYFFKESKYSAIIKVENK